MQETDSVATSPTLLGRLRADPADQVAWQEFVHRYGGLIRRWCRHWGLQESDAEDVVQNVLLALARQMKTFEYRRSGRFRSWLKTVARRAWADFLDRRRADTASGETRIMQLLVSQQARDELLEKIDEEAECELLEAAIEQVRPRVQPHTWQAFQLTAVEGLSGAEAAARLDMKTGAVWVARSRVQKMLQEEIRRIEED